MRDYICKLQRTIGSVCEEYGLKPSKSSDVGVFIGNNKIAAIGESRTITTLQPVFCTIFACCYFKGVHGRRFVTTHGIALNCDVNLSWFSHIVPCGLADRGVTSLTAELGRTVTVADAIPTFLQCFKDEFECDFEMQNSVNEIINNLEAD